MEKYNKPWVWIVGAIVLFLLISIGYYNKLVSLDQNVKSSWAQVENQLQRRNDLIPNLVSTVKGYASHEKIVFAQVSQARADMVNAMKKGSQADKIQAAKDVSSALSRLIAIAENYPNLKASENFIRLQDELAGTENRIAVERMRYNQAVESYNISVRKFPMVIFVRKYGFDDTKPYFEVPESAKEVPVIGF
jgi:LemA protein